MEMEICIAKKVVHQNVQFLDFAVNDDNEKLLVFDNFKAASEYLRSEVGEGPELLDFLIVPLSAHLENPRMQELLKKGKEVYVPKPVDAKATSIPASFGPVNVECYFTLECNQFEIVNNDSIVDKTTGKQLIPVLAFVDATDTNQLVQVPNFKLASAFIGEIAETEA